MAWITVQVSQNGNSTRRYNMVAFPGMTVFDSIGAGPEVGSSCVRITDHFVCPGPLHQAEIEILGANASTFRIRGGLQV
jgi:hypothetical protein